MGNNLVLLVTDCFKLPSKLGSFSRKLKRNFMVGLRDDLLFLDHSDWLFELLSVFQCRQMATLTYRRRLLEHWSVFSDFKQQSFWLKFLTTSFINSREGRFAPEQGATNQGEGFFDCCRSPHTWYILNIFIHYLKYLLMFIKCYKLI